MQLNHGNGKTNGNANSIQTINFPFSLNDGIIRNMEVAIKRPLKLRSVKMAANKEYSRKSDAVRAAKKEFGEGWESSVQIFDRDTPEGKRYIYDFPRGENGNIENTAKAITDTLTAAIPAIVNAVIHPVAKEEAPAEPPVEAQEPESGGIRIPFGGEEEPSEKDLAKAEANDHMAAGDRLANAQTANVDPLKPRVSTVEKPTKLVWAIADELTSKDPKVSRKDVINECVKRGIAYGTARTQFQHWFKQKTDSAKEPRAKLENGKVIPPQANTAKR